MSGTLIRQIPAKRLRPGAVPEDITIDVVECDALAPHGKHGDAEENEVLYTSQIDGAQVRLKRMTVIERAFGAESVFEDHLGNCYVSLDVMRLKFTLARQQTGSSRRYLNTWSRYRMKPRSLAID